MDTQDAHTHFFSRPFFETLARLSPHGGDPGALAADVAARAGLELPPADVGVHRDRWLAEMDRAGVSRIVTFASLPPEAPAVAQAVAGSGGRLVGYTVVDPTAEGAEAFAARALEELGLRGLLLFPAMHGYAASDPRCFPIYERARAARAPVIVHCGILVVKLRDLFGLPRPYVPALADPLLLVPAANRFADVPFVVPHFGAGHLRELLMVGVQCENVHVDTSSSNTWIRTQLGLGGLDEVFARTLECFGAERVLFGTDSSTFPAGYRDDRRDEQLASLARVGADDAQVAAIMGGNLERLLPR